MSNLVHKTSALLHIVAITSRLASNSACDYGMSNTLKWFHRRELNPTFIVQDLQVFIICVTCRVASIFSIVFMFFMEKTTSSFGPHIIDRSKVLFGSQSSSEYNSKISVFAVSNWVRRWLFKFYDIIETMRSLTIDLGCLNYF